MRFEQLWREDRPEFWTLLFHVSAAPEIPTIGKLIGVTVLGELGAELDDLEPLIAALESSDPVGTTTFIEIAHEAMIRSWTRLRDWIEEERELLNWRERLMSRLYTVLGLTSQPIAI